MSRPKNEHFMLNFDLSVEALEKYYPKKHYRQAWRDIGRFLKNNGFKHVQYSGYLSKEPLSRIKCERIFRKLCETEPWLPKCAESFTMTKADVNAMDLMKTLTYKDDFEKTSKEFENISAKDITGRTPKAEAKTSIRSQIADAENKLERKEQNKVKVKDLGLEL